MTRKIHQSMDNIIDNFLIDMCELLCPHFKKMNFTPNMITTIGLFFGLLSIYFLYKDNYVASAIFFWISYFFDCLDGHYARKYNMCTEFGDYYDHIRDVVITFSILFLIFRKMKNNKNKIYFTIVMLFFAILVLTHMGCQELNSNSASNNACLSIFKGMCKDPDLIYVTRFFGCSTFILITSIFILMLNHM